MATKYSFALKIKVDNPNDTDVYVVWEVLQDGSASNVLASGQSKIEANSSTLVTATWKGEQGNNYATFSCYLTPYDTSSTTYTDSDTTTISALYSQITSED